MTNQTSTEETPAAQVVVRQCRTMGGAVVSVVHDTGRISMGYTWWCAGCGEGRSSYHSTTERDAFREANAHAKECRSMPVPVERPVEVTSEMRAEVLRIASSMAGRERKAMPGTVLDVFRPLLAWLDEAETAEDLDARWEGLRRWHTNRALADEPMAAVAVEQALAEAGAYYAAIMGRAL